MFLPILIYVSSRSFISLRDPNFSGEDKVLAAALAARVPRVGREMLLPTTPPTDLHDIPNFQELVKNYSLVNVTGSGRRKGPVVGRDANAALKDAMAQQIYKTMYTLEELIPVIREYDTNPQYRLAYAYNMLDKYYFKLRRVHYRHTLNVNYVQWGLRFIDVLKHYEHLARYQVDMTYTVEYLSFLHHSIMESREEIRRLTNKGDDNKKKQQEKGG